MIDLTPNIILSKPQLGENIGSCARAMKNFGIEKLRLIEPRDGWPNSSAYAISAGADNILDKTKLSVVIQITALRREIDKMSKKLKTLGLTSTSRTGAIAMTRGAEVFK